ncbi:MAG: acetyl-CoA carboxylase carboxyl transferase subunit alpha [Firmicutes bacterium HGW-Firmicutes-14]|jgi:acetyl-CoA carboxylase carboxyl transferase subunit alpha|nr:MAG: acetyl-CoA carboxylase carboxyl transferase subunit alpha [Firmicutes bacterium HGW-Firmicutes-14]
MANILLEFEKPIVELEAKIQELKNFSSEKEIDLSDEIKTLQNKADSLTREIYGKLTPWQRVLLARHPERPGTADYIKLIFEDFFELHGDRRFGDDPAVIGGIARFNGQPVTVIGHVKGKDTKDNLTRNFGMPHPEGNRKAIRLMEQAEKFGRPVISFVDTPGAFPGIGAEERGQAEAIATNLTRMMSLKVPVIATVIGEGGSGGALAIAIGDHVAMLENSVYSISSPEAFASILWKDPAKANEAAAVMKMTARDLEELGVIDEIVPEPLGGAHRNKEEMAKILCRSLKKSLNGLMKIPDDKLLEKRFEKFRGIGQFVSG